MRVKFEDIIIHEDEHFLVANKPPFMASLEDRNDPQNLQKLAKQFHPELSACHRLDKETSGCILFAKDPEAYRHASSQFENRTVKKVYHAFVNGTHEFNQLEVNLPIAAQANGRVRIDLKEGKPSRTLFQTLELYKQHSLIECRPETGRMHQIRIHLAQKQATLINDELYGGTVLYLSQIKRRFKLKRDTEEQPLIKRFALHATSLSFHNMEKEVNVVADYPKDMRVLAKQLSLNKH